MPDVVLRVTAEDTLEGKIPDLEIIKLLQEILIELRKKT